MLKVFFIFLIVSVYSYGKSPQRMGSFESVYTPELIQSRTISFSGYNWDVKSSTYPVGPGPNYFSESTENVWVDSLDQLHLRITNSDDKWYCAEVILQESFGYGTYVFNTISRVGAINENIILGLFTWDNFAPNDYYREIDIEFARWGDAFNPTNAQYVIQPYEVSGNLQRWYIPVNLDSSTHTIDWQNDNINFKAMYGLQYEPPFDSLLFEWDYFGQHLTKPGQENIRINFWLRFGYAPTNSQEAEVIISGFKYIPNDPVDIEDRPVSEPAVFELYQNYPNPFNDKTVFSYRLSVATDATLLVFNTEGRLLQQQNLGFQDAGLHKFQFDASVLASGIYYYRIQTAIKQDQVDRFMNTGKFVLLK